MASITTVMADYFGRGFSDSYVTTSSPCEDGYIYIPVAFVIMLYLVYLVECWHCHTRLELKHKVDVNTVYDKISKMRDAMPIIWWKAVCYHYVRKTRHVTRYRNGDSFTSTQVYYERVNTHTAGSAFNFSQCGVKDISSNLIGLENYSATKIRFSKGYSFVGIDAEYEFEEQRNRFFRENERRDDYIETREGMDLLNVNFKEYMITFADPDNLPWYVSHIVFWIASFLLMSWPLRVIIEFKTAYVHYHVHKIFGTNYLDPAHSVSGGMTRANTMGSAELDVMIQNNFIVPSYSEALLMNCGRTIDIPDANGNVTSSKYGATRSLTFTSLSSITNDKDSLQNHRCRLQGNPFQRCNSYSIVNGGLVIQNDMQFSDRYANSPRRKPRRLFVVSRRNDDQPFSTSSPNSPSDAVVFINQRTQIARMLRHDCNSMRGVDSSVVSTTASNRSLYRDLGSNSEFPQSPTDRTQIGESPPSYHLALNMQRPQNSRHNESGFRTVVSTERDSLNPGHSNSTNYHTIMETSL
ncbi:hypothetical protein FSP39_020639 [Pinctada imbricata]|uniref:Transmembrane protein 151B n=1 Tax=Pinctada imbricata TaxID=66713 RepID=A0AA88XXH7_PINIB|nr:hypothetical protein FSP39_020639 [Pinctada imbricata]